MSRKFATVITEVEFGDGDHSHQSDRRYLDALKAALEKAAMLVSARYGKEEVTVTHCSAGVIRPPVVAA
jgi:hypothetical protein